MTVNFKTVEDMNDFLFKSKYEKNNMQILEKEFSDMWGYFEKNKLLLNFSEIDGYKAFCRLQNSYITIGSMVKLMKIVEDYYLNKKYQEFDEADILLIVANSYNVFLEKIADFISIICDVKKLCNKKGQFYSAPDIIDQLEKAFPNNQMFRYCDRRIRNSIAHYDFNIFNGKFVYYKNKHDYAKIGQVILDKKLIINGSLSLNRVVVFLFKKIEQILYPYFDEKKLKKDWKKFEKDSEKILDEQKNKDSL